MWLKCPKVSKYFLWRRLLPLFIYSQPTQKKLKCGIPDFGFALWGSFCLFSWLIGKYCLFLWSGWHESVWGSRGIREQPVQLNTSRTLVISQICRRPPNHLLAITLGLIAHACRSSGTRVFKSHEINIPNSHSCFCSSFISDVILKK